MFTISKELMKYLESVDRRLVLYDYLFNLSLDSCCTVVWMILLSFYDNFAGFHG
jgi:hypothetical protein